MSLRPGLPALVLLCVLLDVSNPFAPGVFEFSLGASVDGVGRIRARVVDPPTPIPGAPALGGLDARSAAGADLRAPLLPGPAWPGVTRVRPEPRARGDLSLPAHPGPDDH